MIPNMHPEKVLRTVARDRADGAFCDLEIVCGDTRFPAHRVIVCSQSPVIQAACVGPWKVKNQEQVVTRRRSCRNLQEAASGTFEIKESSPVLVKRMIDYMYSGSYDQFPRRDVVDPEGQLLEELSELGTACPIIHHAKMVTLADMYMVKGLGDFAMKTITKLVKDEKTSHMITECIPEIYASSFDSCGSIRQLIIASMRERTARPPLDPHMNELLQDVMGKVPEFTCDFLKSYLEAPLLGHCDKCGREKTVPVVALQCKCQKCDRGGASTLSAYYHR
ncbi:hypothetical protein E4U21_003752 [Claviceps maximensis]|nr:hypothetical protein E4U21_003752 [Claviceps maximensis]